MWTTLTATGGLVVMDRRLLMIRQRRPYGVFWEMPSGYHEPGESLEQTTAREVLEETGVAVEVGPMVCTLVWERESDRRRNLIERVVGWYKECRALGTRYEKLAVDYLALWMVAIIEDLLKRYTKKL